MKALVFGGGWLGHLISEHFDCKVSQLDILDSEAVGAQLLDIRPEVVFNAAGKCGIPNIDWCKETEGNRRLTKYVNAYAPAILYHVVEGVSQRLQRPMMFVHLSSGCLWEWGTDITEDRKPEPPSYYSWTKAEGEARLPAERCLIVRFRMPTSGVPHARNLITKLSGYNEILDAQNSITIVKDLLTTLETLVQSRACGVYNVVNSGSISPSEIMQMYLEIVDKDRCFRITTVEDLKQRGIIKDGRSNVTLSTEKLKGAGIVLPEIRERVRECLVEYAKQIKADSQTPGTETP